MQRLIKADVSLLGTDLKVVAEEFSNWEDSSRRIDLLCIDTLCCTNVIESAFSIVETVCRNVKRWRDGDHIERWVGSGLRRSWLTPVQKNFIRNKSAPQVRRSIVPLHCAQFYADSLHITVARCY